MSVELNAGTPNPLTVTALCVKGELCLLGIQQFESNALALAGGLVVGDIYHNASYALFIVH